MNADAMPVGIVFAGTVLGVLLSIEAGYRMGLAARRRSDDEKESPASAMAGAVLGLAAFLLAFTFGIGSDRYDTRKQLVREEATAIRTAWYRSDFLPEPDRSETKTLLREYLDVRLSVIQSGYLDPQHLNAIFAEVERDQNRLWDMAVANARKDMNSDVAALYIESLNDMFGVQALRVAVGLQTRIPAGIWFALIGTTIFGMMAIGFQTGIAGSKRSMARPILALSFALVLELIAALDRPNSGFIRIPQQPLINLRDAMATQSGGSPGEAIPVFDHRDRSITPSDAKGPAATEG